MPWNHGNNGDASDERRTGLAASPLGESVGFSGPHQGATVAPLKGVPEMWLSNSWLLSFIYFYENPHLEMDDDWGSPIGFLGNLL